MRRFVAILFPLILALIAYIPPAAGNDLGVVLMHGKGGSPGYLGELASTLGGKGYRVSTPTMPWAETRIYDASFDEAMREIDREIDSLRQRGAKLVVVAGHSLGANAALGYAASRDGASGIIALAPAHTPELPVFTKRVALDVARAKDLVATGKGREKQFFVDLNQGRTSTVAATPEVYLSWFDPDGPAVMPRSAASFKVPTPLLVVEGSHDRTAKGRDYVFDKAPAHPKSRFITVPAGHVEVPSAAISAVVSWLGSLRQ